MALALRTLTPHRILCGHDRPLVPATVTPTSRTRALSALAGTIDPALARDAADRFSSFGRGTILHAAAVLCATAYPATAAKLEDDAAFLRSCFDSHGAGSWNVDRFLADLRQNTFGLDDESCAQELRKVARRHRLRIALREILPRALGGDDFEVTAKEISDLASATVAFSLTLARRIVSDRFGEPLRADGSPSCFAVLGMGKLGGMELNVGSDIDLVFVYDTDDGETKSAAPISLHEYWSRVARRLVSLLDEQTSEGFVWRVDLRLRPEGTRGAVVNSLPAMLRYYETWGRTWERAVLLRARAIAGDAPFGAQAIEELTPFIYRRGVDPSIAAALSELVDRARSELGIDTLRDIKQGHGGIRDLEMFVQALQLIWGGQDPSLRVRNTLDALRKLRDRGFVTDREAAALDEAYVLLRRIEHFVQNATALQTHSLPALDTDRARLARALGFVSLEAFDEHLDRTRTRVTACAEGLSPKRSPAQRWSALSAALDAQDAPLAERTLCALIGTPSPELAGNLLALSRRPDALLGELTRDRHPDHADSVFSTLFESADPEQAAYCLRALFARHAFPSVYATLLASNQRATRRFITALGASRFLGDAVASRTELADRVLFSKGMPSADAAREALREELAAADEAESPLDAAAGAVRRARLRVMVETALADLAGEVSVHDVTQVLTAVAESSLELALRTACGSNGPVQGLCAIAVGKLGGQEMGYASDLDVIFVFDPLASGDPDDAIKLQARRAQQTIRVLSAPHEAGPGYALDTRLRPSGSQGVLVTSIASFARYHGLHEDGSPSSSRGGAAAWERQTLVRSRVCAGDLALGARVLRLAQIAAFEGVAPDPLETHRLRMRLETELGKERGDRYDLKLGAGGLLDIEFAVQMLQMRHGKEHQVRVTGTMEALRALEACGYVSAQDASVLREGYEFLRRLEQRLHVVHATSIHLIEKNAPGLGPLARRMGMRDDVAQTAAAQLLERYKELTGAVRETYLRVVGV